MFDSNEMIEKIKLACKERKIKLYKLESDIGLSTGALSRWTKSCPASIETLYKIAEELNISVDYLLGINVTNKKNRSSSNKQEALNSIIQQTCAGDIKWKKIPFSKWKKIQIINAINEVVYDNEIQAYETNFNNYHLMFVHKISSKYNELYIENNNDYILICNNNIISHMLYDSILEFN